MKIMLVLLACLAHLFFILSLVEVSFADGSIKSCGFKWAFDQPDEEGTETIKVYQAGPEAAMNGSRPILFIVPYVKINTDGTRISYNINDPKGKTLAINDIRNAFHNHKRPIADFEKIRAKRFMPVKETWKLLDPEIIEKDNRSGREGLPCVDDKGFLVSMTADTAIDGGFNKQGNCDQTKWIDALSVPAMVIPKESRFQTYNVDKRSAAVMLSLISDNLVLGMVGDSGPATELGEGTVAMNRALNGLQASEVPKNREDAKKRFQANKTAFIVFPDVENKIPRPINGESVKNFVGNLFENWGGKQRLLKCLKEIQ